jgi:hypothetical protein
MTRKGDKRWQAILPRILRRDLLLHPDTIDTP